jgi:chemotaxis protein histidine kinase CheA
MEDDFLEEVQASIDALQSGLITLSGGAAEPQLVNELFRASHSIKGQSGQMAVGPLEKVAHKLEDILDLVRQEKLSLTPESTSALLTVIDALQSILEELRSTRHVEHPLERELQLMERIATGGELELTPPAAPKETESPPSKAPAEAQKAQPRPSPPNAGTPAKPTAPKPSSSKATSQYLRVGFSKVDQVMNLVGDLFINKIKLHDGVHALDELHLQVTRLQTIVAQQQEAGGDGLVLDDEESRRLMAGITAVASELESLSDRLSAATGETDMISSDLRDHVMVMRMVPLDAIFGRLGRVVFDAVQKECRGNDPGFKAARLVIEGADAEIDKVISNVLEVPLVHIVRNAVAHGIEPAAEREALGKPAEGSVRVTAGQRGSQFVIQVKDDGRGMLPDVIGHVAIDKGLIAEEDLTTMSEREILGLIFRPGFTTAEKADDLKGRGVGLDEVMSKINQVKGNIDVASESGKGTTVTLSLPLTLAINTVLIGEVAEETVAIPMSVVERVVKVAEREIERLGESEVFTLLAQTVPLVRADSILAMGRSPAQRPDACYVVVLNVGDRRFGLALDRMTGKQDVVVKSLGTLIGEAPLVAGATLLGERCVLILDPVDIALKLGRGRVATAGSRKPQPRTERLRPRLLLVDDDASTRIRLRRVFEEAGLEVHEAADGEEALAMAGETRFQLVSTDIVMPKMDGYELTRRLRAMPNYGEVPILMISSKGEDVDKRAGFEAGVDYYLVKPVERSELLELIDEVRL